MPKIIKFPPKLACDACRTKMRPATKAEIQKGLADSKWRHLYAQAVQGDADRKVLIEGVPEWFEMDTVPASWLMVCDHCGGKTLWSKEEAVEDAKF